MAKEYDDTNHFALFPNDWMREGKNDPDLSGFINIEGQEYWFKGWTYHNKDGSIRVVSGVIGEERETREPEEAPAKRKPGSKAPAKSGWR